MLDNITPLILTLDEAPNVGRVLDQLRWAKDIVVVDSFSRDGTCEIVRRYPNARLFQRQFDRHAIQWNFGLTQTGISTDWVLALDSDYIVPKELILEIRALSPGPEVGGYRASFTYCIEGRPLRNAVYPPVTVLYRRKNAEYAQDGHTQRLRLPGEIRPLAGRILHDDRKSMHRWLRSQNRYMWLESAKLAQSRFSELPFQDQIRRLIFVAPPAMLFYCLFAKGNVFDGRPGLIYALQRTVAETILSLHLLRMLFSQKRSTT